MPSKKQRRRREKLKRHEWELVQLDEEGNEVLLERGAGEEGRRDERQARREATAAARCARSSRRRGAARPSAASLFVPFLFIFLSIGNERAAGAWRASPTRPCYAVVFIPMFFFIDRLTYRAYQQRLGQR